MTVIERWTIWHTPGTTPGTHKSYVEGPAAGDWAGQGVEVVPSTTYQGAAQAIRDVRAAALVGLTANDQTNRLYKGALARVVEITDDALRGQA